MTSKRKAKIKDKKGRREREMKVSDKNDQSWRYATAFWAWYTLVRALEDITPCVTRLVILKFQHDPERHAD